MALPTQTKLDIVQAIWDKEGPNGLGWIVAFFMAGYIVFLHSRLGKVYKDFNVFTQEASKNLIPILTKATEVMERNVQLGDEVADSVKTVRERQDELISTLRVIVGTFIDTKTFWLFGKDQKATPVEPAPPPSPSELAQRFLPSPPTADPKV